MNKKKKRREKKNSEAHQNSNYDTCIIRKISMKSIQQHKKRSSTMTRVDHTCHPKVVGGSLDFDSNCCPLRSSLGDLS